jgi:hypothetical protein
VEGGRGLTRAGWAAGAQESARRRALEALEAEQRSEQALEAQLRATLREIRCVYCDMLEAGCSEELDMLSRPGALDDVVSPGERLRPGEWRPHQRQRQAEEQAAPAEGEGEEEQEEGERADLDAPAWTQIEGSGDVSSLFPRGAERTSEIMAEAAQMARDINTARGAGLW